MKPRDSHHGRHETGSHALQSETDRLHARINRLGAVMIVSGVLLALATGVSAVLLYGHLERIARVVANLETRLDRAGTQELADNNTPTPMRRRILPKPKEPAIEALERHERADSLQAMPLRPADAVASNVDTPPVAGISEPTRAMSKNNARDVAMDAFQESRFAECANIAARLLERTPDDNELRIVLGRAQLALDALTESASTLEQAVSRNPESAEAWRLWGLALLHRLKPTDAVFRLETAAQLDTHNARIWFELGVARTNAGNSIAAIEAFDRAVALEPTLAEAHFGRGLCMMHLGDMIPAQAAFDQAYLLDSTLEPAMQRAQSLAMEPTNSLSRSALP